MKNTIACLLLLASVSGAQILPALSPAEKQAATDISQVATAAKTATFAQGPWAGKLNKKFDPSPAAYQSATSLKQAIGLEKSVWSLYKGYAEIVRVGVFAGVYKPFFTTPNVTPSILGGGTLFVPGSALDWAMGTNLGATWIPRLKTGWLLSWDVTHPKTMHAKPDFTGPGISYSFF